MSIQAYESFKFQKVFNFKGSLLSLQLRLFVTSTEGKKKNIVHVIIEMWDTSSTFSVFFLFHFYMFTN